MPTCNRQILFRTIDRVSNAASPRPEEPLVPWLLTGTLHIIAKVRAPGHPSLQADQSTMTSKTIQCPVYLVYYVQLCHAMLLLFPKSHMLQVHATNMRAAVAAQTICFQELLEEHPELGTVRPMVFRDYPLRGIRLCPTVYAQSTARLVLIEVRYVGNGLSKLVCDQSMCALSGLFYSSYSE